MFYIVDVLPSTLYQGNAVENTLLYHFIVLRINKPTIRGQSISMTIFIALLHPRYGVVTPLLFRHDSDIYYMFLQDVLFVCR